MRLHSLIILVLSLATSLRAADKIVFNRDIRPILSDKCFHCHGPDEAKREAGLRLDKRDAAMRPVDSDLIAIVPGKPDSSELIARVFAHEDDDVMPPSKLGKPLSDKEKSLLKQWISEGAEYEGHWAFEPVRRAAPPLISNLKFEISNPIDAFIRARLPRENLQPSPEADPATLIRRVSLDLTGLPPTPTEVEEFVAAMNTEKSAQSPVLSARSGLGTSATYEQVVDRLLKSPHYGERMAMQWLDFARYADSHGFQTDSSRAMWPWRDWVIRAFNDNMPFDQFTVQQLAGDLLPGAKQDQVLATGFNRNHRINGEGGIIAEEWRIENIIDRVETTGFTWMALTLNCSRCHDHKYDPISQKEFYQLFAFFNNTEERGTITGGSNRSGGNEAPVINVTDAGTSARMVALEKEIVGAKEMLAVARKELPKLIAAWEPDALKSLNGKASAWSLLQPVNVKSKEGDKGATLTRQGDGSYLASGPNPAKDIYLFDAPLPKEGAGAFLLECLPDASLPGGGVGRYSNSNFVLSDFDVFVQRRGGKPEKQDLASVAADYSQKGYEIDNVLKKGRGKGWAIDGPTKKDARRAMFVLKQPLAHTDGAMLLLRLRHEAVSGHNIGRFRISSTALSGSAVKLDGDAMLATAKVILETPAGKRTAAQRSDLEKYFLASADSPARRANEELARKEKELENLRAVQPSAMVMKEMPQPRDAFILTRGEYDKPAAKVTMGLPAVFPPMPEGAPMNRLGLARWITDPSHPLTARVWVNRAWEKFFGVGLSKTTENLGSQAEYPVHPELLDWLASEFMRSGWDMKAFQKMIVMSASYRQDSRVTPELIARDPENRLAARGPRFRLDGEVIRDQALAISGLLAPTIGGPSVRPYMPEDVWDETSKYGDLRGYKADSGDALYRRTMYTIWKRTAAPPTMLLFDSPSREICSVKRTRTNTPLQALSLLNEVTFVEAARSLAERMMREGGTSPESRIRFAYKVATSREPDAEALRILAAGQARSLADFKGNPESATKLITQGASKPDAKLDPVELAACTMTAGVLLNLDRVVTRD